MIIFLKYLSICFFALILSKGWSQDSCITQTLTIFGQQDKNERGKSLIPTQSGDGVYVAGFKDDSVLLFEAALNGEIRWAKTLDVIAGTPDHVSCIISDDENMLVVSGMAGDQGAGGLIFCFRYDPYNHKVLWAQEYFTAARNYSFTVIQNELNGNFLLVNNPHSSQNDCEILHLKKSTGDIISNLSKNYHYGGSDQIIDLVYYKNFLYGTGRFTEGSSFEQMRHTIAKIDPADGKVVWIKMGHLSQNNNARLYGWDLLVDNDKIYSIYSGDPSGTSSNNNKLFLQKTNLNGNLEWLRQYELPGQSDDGYEMIKSANGIVVLAGTKLPGENIILFKIDLDGNLLWSKSFDFSEINRTSIDRGASQLIEINNQLIFTGVGFLSNGGTDLVLVSTDLSGNMQSGCISNHDIPIQVLSISNPVFRSINTGDFTVNPPKRNKSVLPINTQLSNNSSCAIEDTLVSYVTAQICQGQSYFGYNQTGQYSDHFISTAGCDSVRFLDLSVTVITDSITIVLCDGDHYMGHSLPGIYVDTFTTVAGCDSIAKLELYLGDNVSSSIMASVCDYPEFERPGVYIDSLKTYYGCDSIRTLTLRGASKYIPNVFSPNGDGVNDHFEVILFPDNGYSLEFFGVFDRFGNMVYTTNNWPIRWDGAFNGQPFMPGVFAYVLKYHCGNQTITEHGNISLIR